MTKPLKGPGGSLDDAWTSYREAMRRMRSPQADHEAQLVEAAGRRYWNDAVFYAAVLTAVGLAERHQPADGFDRWHHDSLIMGASMALHLVDEHGADLAKIVRGG